MGIMIFHSFPTENEVDRLNLYEEYQKRYPNAEAPKRLPLNFSTGMHVYFGEYVWLTVWRNVCLTDQKMGFTHLLTKCNKRNIYIYIYT